MRKALPILFLLLAGLSASAQTIQSPGGKLSLVFSLTADGEPAYELSFAGKPVIRKSRLGMELKDQPALTKGFAVAKSDTAAKDETWETGVGRGAADKKQLPRAGRHAPPTRPERAHRNLALPPLRRRPRLPLRVPRAGAT